MHINLVENAIYRYLPLGNKLNPWDNKSKNLMIHSLPQTTIVPYLTRSYVKILLELYLEGSSQGKIQFAGRGIPSVACVKSLLATPSPCRHRHYGKGIKTVGLESQVFHFGWGYTIVYLLAHLCDLI